MQPLPPAITSTIFSSAASHLTAAATTPGPAAAPMLSAAAHEIWQGIPSLRTTLGRDGSASLAASLEAAARGAHEMSSKLAAGAAPSGASQTIGGWARLAADAAAVTAPPPPSW